MDSHLEFFCLLFVLLISQFLERHGSLSPLFFLLQLFSFLFKEEDGPYSHGIYRSIRLEYLLE
jgi:hypothetical protein